MTSTDVTLDGSTGLIIS